MSAIDRLVSNYDRQMRLLWATNVSGKQRVWFAVYPPAEERRLRARLPRRLQLHGRPHHLDRNLPQPMKNRDLYFRDPTAIELLNNGVSKVSEIANDERQIKTLRFELETFVCDGEYARGLERILKAYLDGLGREEQKAVWVSGFFGSGKSHLVKVLRYLWEDYRFADGATARSLVKLPAEISDLLKELTIRSKPLGGLRAAGGTLGAGSMDNLRLAFVQLVLRSAGLPEDLAQARFILWLRSSGLDTPVAKALKKNNCNLFKEVTNLNDSGPL